MSFEKSVKRATNLPEVSAPKSASVFSKAQNKSPTEQICSKPPTAAVRQLILTNEFNYDEYLKNGSREMVKHWDNTLEKIRQRKMAALKKKEEQKRAEG